MKRSLLALTILFGVLLVVFTIRNTYGERSSYSPVDESKQLLKSEYSEIGNLNKISESEQTDSENSNNKIISASEIAKHNSKDDCWVVYDKKIYDLTSFISKHPGGEDKIIRNCGTTTKFQEEFTNKHGTAKVKMLMEVGTFIGDFDLVGTVE